MSRILFVIAALLVASTLFSQTVEKASLIKFRNGFGGGAAMIYKPLKNGSRVLTGKVDYGVAFHNWNITNADSLPGDTRSFVALVDKNDSVLWVKYWNAWVQNVETDDKNNIYLTGTYKSRLHFSVGDTLAIPSNALNQNGNVFIVKLDSAGNRKWWKTTDNDAYGQFEPYGDYIKIDPDYNVYILGHFDYHIRFDSKTILENPWAGYMPFLAKLDSGGNYKWIRDTYSDGGLPCGLSIDSNRVYIFYFLGGSVADVRMRRYDFSGKLLDKQVVTNFGWEVFWAANTNVKNNRILTNTDEGIQKKIGYYDLKGSRIWSVNYSIGISFTNLQFTRQNKIFFSGLGISSDTNINKIGNTVVNSSRFWGFMDTAGNVLSVKRLNKTDIGARNPFLADGRLYLAPCINTYSTSNSNTYTLDTITFKNLNYYDSTTGYGWGYSYQLLAQYKVDDSGYYNPGPGPYSMATDTCFNEEGLNKCSVITAVNAIPENQSLSVFPVPSSNILNIDFLDYRQVVGSKAQFIDVSGHVKKEISLPQQNNKINISELPPGMYVLMITFRKGRTESRKIIVLNN